MVPLLSVKLALFAQQDLPLLLKKPLPVPDLIKLLSDRGFLFSRSTVVAMIVLIALIALTAFESYDCADRI